MKENKNIDDFFKEQLGSFNEAPSPEVWENIQAKLKEEKEDRKVIPLWWKVGGVAAVLALLLTVSGVFNSNNPIENNTTIVEETTEKDNDNNLLKKDNNITPKGTNTANDIVSSQENSSEDNLIEKTSDSDSFLELTNEKERVVSTSEEKSVKKNSKVTTNNNFERTTKNAVATQQNISKETNKNSVVKRAIITEKTINSEKEAVAVTSKEKNSTSQDKFTNPENEENKIIVPSNSENTTVAEEEVEKLKDKDSKEGNKKSIFDAIEENKEAVAKEDDKKANPYWEVTPNVGPVYYNSVNGGSSLSPSFADNPQSGDTNISYGVAVSYNFNDRLSIRTGLNNVNLGYATGDVVLATSPTEVALKSVTYNNGGKNVLTAFDKGKLENLPTDPSNPFSQITQKSTSGNAEIIQNISYFEVPMELKYAILNKRFGINMIGGFSTLFLGNNEVSVADGDYRSVLGEANNLNTMSFSTNIGLGFDYKISKRFKFNIEPMFKYQLNPYNTSVDFNPYYFGLYSGVSFKF